MWPTSGKTVPHFQLRLWSEIAETDKARSDTSQTFPNVTRRQITVTRLHANACAETGHFRAGEFAHGTTNWAISSTEEAKSVTNSIPKLTHRPLYSRYLALFIRPIDSLAICVRLLIWVRPNEVSVAGTDRSICARRSVCKTIPGKFALLSVVGS